MFDFLAGKFSAILSSVRGQTRLSEATVKNMLSQVHDALVQADVPYEVVQRFMAELQEEITARKLTQVLKADEQLMKVIYDTVLHFLGNESADKDPAASFTTLPLPATLLFIGLQGSGKTTTITKLAVFLLLAGEKRGKKRKILVASVDFCRPAAQEQLALGARAVGVDYYESRETTPVAAAKDILKFRAQQGYDLLLLDTAGRLHIDQELLHELQELKQVVQPAMTLLVLDAMMGQESLAVARAFESAVGFSGALLTKMDSEARGGAAFAFRYMLKKRIFFIGVGEKPADFEPFRPERIAQRLLGQGDILTLVEKASTAISDEEQQRIAANLEQGVITLDDFARQMALMSQMGSLGALLKYLPGMGSAQLPPEAIEKGEQELKKFRAIIDSMTLKERRNPQLLNDSRKRRVARGAGVTASDVTQLLTKFEESKRLIKLFKKQGGMQQLLSGFGFSKK